MKLSAMFPGTACQAHYAALAEAASEFKKTRSKEDQKAMVEAWTKLMTEPASCDGDLDLKATAALTYRMEFVPVAGMADRKIKGVARVRRAGPKVRK